MMTQYQLTQAEYDGLVKRTGLLCLIKNLPKFHAEDEPITFIGILLYLDEWYGKPGAHDVIFKAVFASRSMDDKIAIMNYIEWIEEQ